MDKKIEEKTKSKLSVSDLRFFSENIRIFRKAVEKAIQENKEAGIPERDVYAQ